MSCSREPRLSRIWLSATALARWATSAVERGRTTLLYDFRQLSPADLEELTRDLLQAEWGVRLEAFKTGRDQGIDLRYAPVIGQPTIVQCKHYVGSTVA